MKFLFDLIAAFVPSLFAPLVKFIKLEILNIYIKSVDVLRGFFTLGILAAVFVAFASTGFILIHIALFIIVPWEQNTKGLILLLLGFIYLIVPSAFIIRICSRRTWLKVSGADAMHRSISGED